MKNLSRFALIFGLGLSSVSFGVTVEDVQSVRDSIERARFEVNRALSSVSNMDPSNNPSSNHPPSGGDGVWAVPDEERILEDDAIAVPIYHAAGNNLYLASSLADQAVIDLSSGINIQQGTFKFSQACAKMAIARSQIARANLAAAQIPVGNLQAFGPALREVVEELNAQHIRCI
jgi:hypothetical protein